MPAISYAKLVLVFALIAGVLVAGDGRTQAQEAVVDSVSQEVRELTPLEIAREQFTMVQAELDSLLRLELRSRDVEGDELELIRVQAKQQIGVIDTKQSQFIKVMHTLDTTAAENLTLFAEVGDFHAKEFRLYERALKLWSDSITSLRNKRRGVSVEDENKLEAEITLARGSIDRLIVRMNDVLVQATELGLEIDEAWRQYDNLINSRTENLVGRLQIADDHHDELESQLKSAERAGASSVELSTKRTQVQLAADRITGVAASLMVTVDLLSSRGFETAKYSRFMIKTTGKISERFLDPKVFVGLVQDFGSKIWRWLADNGPTVLVKLLIVFVTVVVFRFFFRFVWWITRATGLINLTRLMTQLGHSILLPVSTVLGFFTGLWLVGVDPTTLLTGAGVAGVIIGLALQDSLSNLAAGFFLLTTRPFDIDDVICSGDMMGTVKDMMIANTTIVTFDGRRLLIPNRMLWAGVIENRSVEARRRVDVVVRVAFDEDIDRAISIIRALLADDSRVLKTPGPDVFVGNWEDSWVEIAVRPWTKTSDWWNLYTNLAREVMLRFAAEGIDIPLPQRVVSKDVKPSPESPGS